MALLSRFPEWSSDRNRDNDQSELYFGLTIEKGFMRLTLGLILSALLAGPQGPVAPPAPPPRPPLRIGGGIPTGPEAGDGLIEGVVRRLDTGAPLPDARVNLTGLADRTTGALFLREAATDAAGRFVFRNLPASNYTVRVSLANYFAPPIAGEAAAVATASVNTGVQKTSSLALSLTPGGTINGSVRDDNGQPLSNIPVSALRITYRDGRKTLQSAKTIQSDARGEFRLPGIPPGEYYVRANEIYFPGVPEAELATLVVVRGGDEVPASLRILPIKTFRVSGTVVNAIPELASEPAYFFLTRRDAKIVDATAASMFSNLGRGRGQGHFEITGVRPGIYDLMPAASAHGNSTENFAAAIASGTAQIYTGRVVVEVRDRDVNGVTVTVTRGADLNVHVNATAAPSVALPTVRLGLRPVDALPTPLTASNLAARSVASADGNLQFLAVPEGIYALVTPVATPGVYIADIRQAERSIYDQGVITVGRDSADPVEVVLAAGGGRVEGTVEGADKVADTIRVSLVPDGSRRDNLLLYRRASLVGGRFVLTDVLPGSYKLYAWEDLPTGADENAEFMTPYENRGRAVTVRAGVVTPDVALPLVRR